MFLSEERDMDRSEVMKRARLARQQHVLAWGGSGLTQAAYCRQHNIDATTFSGWLRHARAGTVPETVDRNEHATVQGCSAAVVACRSSPTLDPSRPLLERHANHLGKPRAITRLANNACGKSVHKCSELDNDHECPLWVVSSQ